MNPRTWLTSEPVAEAVGEAIAICRDRSPRDVRDADSGEVAQAAIEALLEMLDDVEVCAPELPVTADGTHPWIDEPWWNETAAAKWGMTNPSPIDDVWAKCWAYIESRNLTPHECRIVWPIANAVMHAVLPAPKETQ